MILESEKKIFKDLAKYNKTNGGMNFCLAMRDSGGEITLYNRERQPCYGELRKYKSTHQKECTKPNNYKPGDLHHPFPDGRPEALSIGWGDLDINNPEFVDAMLSDESPWRRGFGGTDNLIRDDHGFILKDCSIDPTVLVNMMKYIRQYAPYNIEQNPYTKAKAARPDWSVTQALGITCTMHLAKHSVEPNTFMVGPPVSYFMPVFPVIERIKSCDPFDLTGGTLADRFDYDRTNLANIFSDKKEGASIYEYFLKRYEKDRYNRAQVPSDEVYNTFDMMWNNELKLEVAA